MDKDYVKLMTTKSDESLQVYIDQRNKYHPEAVFAAIDELKKRGRRFTDIELAQIKSDLKEEEMPSLTSFEEVASSVNFSPLEYEPTYRKSPEKTADGKHSPNHIPAGERAKCLLFSVGLIVYGTVGVYVDDLYVPGKRSRGLHFHGIPCWIMYFAFLFAAITLLSVIVDHYDKRNNETNYQMFARSTRIIGWALFLAAIVLDVFVYHLATE